MTRKKLSLESPGRCICFKMSSYHMQKLCNKIEIERILDYNCGNEDEEDREINGFSKSAWRFIASWCSSMSSET